MDASITRRPGSGACASCARLGVMAAALAFGCTDARAASVLFDFDNLPLFTTLPTDVQAGGIGAHFAGTGQGFLINVANGLGFTPEGFGGYCIWPGGVYQADLLISFSEPLVDLSIHYSLWEQGCLTSATMRVSGYLDVAFVATDTTTADAGPYPAGVLALYAPGGFDGVVIHYDQAPDCPEYFLPIFSADNLTVTAKRIFSDGFE